MFTNNQKVSRNILVEMLTRQEVDEHFLGTFIYLKSLLISAYLNRLEGSQPANYMMFVAERAVPIWHFVCPSLSNIGWYWSIDFDVD